ncbi:hypothetical protein CPB84DRAFT_1760801, partial [Gymnopilus junonius]
MRHATSCVTAIRIHLCYAKIPCHNICRISFIGGVSRHLKFLEKGLYCCMIAWTPDPNQTIHRQGWVVTHLFPSTSIYICLRHHLQNYKTLLASLVCRAFRFLSV